MKRKSLTCTLTAALALGLLLSGCGGSGASGSGGAAETETCPYMGNTTGAGTRGGSVQDDLVLYLTADNQWVLTRASQGAPSVVLREQVYTGMDTLPDETMSQEFLPQLNQYHSTSVWFTPDGTGLYFMADFNGMNGSLYYLDRTALDQDLANAQDCVTLIAENMNANVNDQLLGDGLLFRTGDNALCWYDGTQVIHLADNLAYPRGFGTESAPYYGYASFALLDGGTAVAYTVEDASHPMDLYVRAVDGKSDAVALGSEVKRYFCDPDGELVFFDAICRDSGEAVMQSYVATASGEVEPLSDGRGMLLSAYRDTAYYLQYDSEEQVALYRYDGQERRLLCSDVDHRFDYGSALDHRYVYGSALDQVALYMDRTDGQWYCALGDQDGVPFQFDSGEQTWRYVGMFGGGTAIALWSEDSLVALRLSDGQVTAVDVLASDPSDYTRIQSNGDFFFSANEYIPQDRYGIRLSDLMVCRDGETICLAEDVEIYRTALYAGDEILTLDSLNDFALVQIQDGARQTLAENVSYFLRLNGGQILYLSDGGLFLYDGASTRLSEDALQVFCAGGQYNTGTVSLFLPEFGDQQ